MLAKRLLVDAPFSIYLGWVTVATVANISQVLYSLSWRGGPLPQAYWAVLMIVVASLIALGCLTAKAGASWRLAL